VTQFSTPQAAVRVDVSAPEIIHVTGNDRVAFLHRMLTNNVQSIAIGHGRPAMLLTAKGQVVALMQVLVEAEAVGLLVPGGTGDTVLAALAHFAVMDDVNFELERASTVAVVGSQAVEKFSSVGAVFLPGFADSEPLSHLRVDGVWYIKMQAFGTTGVWATGMPDAVATLSTKLEGVPMLPASEAEGARIAALEPRHGFEYCSEIAGERFPMEVGLEGAIDYGKGCYPGQEPIVRIRDRGKVNWRLGRLRFPAGAPLLVPGAVLSTSEREAAGRLTSVAMWQGAAGASPYPIALALLHASVADGASVNVASDGGNVTAEVLAPGDPA
jgi:tRNA-modifying protein YgfZ